MTKRECISFYFYSIFWAKRRIVLHGVLSKGEQLVGSGGGWVIPTDSNEGEEARLRPPFPTKSNCIPTDYGSVGY